MKVLESIRSSLPDILMLTDPEDLIVYGFDGTAVLNEVPIAVVFPTSTKEVSSILRLCSAHQIPVVSRGSGTGLSGGSIPISKGLVLCMTKFNRILQLDRSNLTILAEPGVTTLEIANTAKKAGLFYPPDPGSMKVSTIGGNVSNNSGGLRGLKYGVTRDYIMGLEVVMANGDITWLGNKCVKDVAGYSLKDVFIGSEGTLGVLTKILIRLIPSPKSRKTMLVVFYSVQQAAATVSAIIAHPIVPCTLEFLDRMTIGCVEDYAKIGLPRDAEAILLIETDGHPSVVEEEVSIMTEIAKKQGAVRIQIAADEAEGINISSARRSAFSALARRKPTTILEDITVPRSELEKTVSFIQKTSLKYQVLIGTFGHFGDGNIHPTFLTDERDPEEMRRVELAMKEIFDFTISLGGTITGEHGVGVAKKSFLPLQFDRTSMQLLRDIKKCFDPAGLLNPGKSLICEDILKPISEANLLKKMDYSILQQCMHCGMCLPTCPTYDMTKLERHSPRGRISLMRAIADDKLQASKVFAEEMYYCLGCLACETACPAGVDYANLFENARAEVERQKVLDNPQRLFIRWSLLRILFRRPSLLRIIGRLLWFWQNTGLQTFTRSTGLVNLLPSKLRKLEPQSPAIRKYFSHELIQPVEKSTQSRLRVAVLTGCIQDLCFSEVNRATVDVLLANECEIHTPPIQFCCGSLHAHNGDLESARDLARRQLDLINPREFDAIISNAGGCGSHLKHYEILLEGCPDYAERAAEWSRKLKDIHEFLIEINFRIPVPPILNYADKAVVTYHESCHLCHGQKISDQPRAILKALPEFELRECDESQWCCGSAGIYNITQPETSNLLQKRKIQNLLATGATTIATANPGCQIQIQNGLNDVRKEKSVFVTHPIVLLAKAYKSEMLNPP